jgi:hypothetical protein
MPQVLYGKLYIATSADNNICRGKGRALSAEENYSFNGEVKNYSSRACAVLRRRTTSLLARKVSRQNSKDNCNDYDNEKRQRQREQKTMERQGQR